MKPFIYYAPLALLALSLDLYLGPLRFTGGEPQGWVVPWNGLVVSLILTVAAQLASLSFLISGYERRALTAFALSVFLFGWFVLLSLAYLYW